MAVGKIPGLLEHLRSRAFGGAPLHKGYLIALSGDGRIAVTRDPRGKISLPGARLPGKVNGREIMLRQILLDWRGEPLSAGDLPVICSSQQKRSRRSWFGLPKGWLDSATWIGRGEPWSFVSAREIVSAGQERHVHALRALNLLMKKDDRFLFREGWGDRL